MSLALGTAALLGFPGYQDPRAIGPSVLRPKDTSRICRVPLFSDAALNQYGEVLTASYTPPAACSAAKALAVILDVEGAVTGVQFDRAGALWLAGVELLRTTTPEPDATGIRWQIERDLSEYAPLFASPSNATLQIPNLVDSTYTGVLYLNVTLTFFMGPGSPKGLVEQAPAEARAPDKAPPFRSSAWHTAQTPRTDGTGAVLVAPPAGQTVVVPLADPTLTSNPWNAMGLAGNQSKNATIKLPRRNVRAARIDLYASGHACEEFWYTNVPDKYMNATGACGGGAYRELQLRIDGTMAGALPPFPVIYTGGVCPLLWRPLTGIHSFNIPPYQFDMGPYLGLLNDGRPHEISITVFGNGPQGSWFVDPVMVATSEEDDGALPLGGTPPTVSATPPAVHVTPSRPGGKGSNQAWRFVTSASSAFVATGELRAADGSFAETHTVRASVQADNDNLLTPAGGLTVGTSTATTHREIASAARRFAAEGGGGAAGGSSGGQEEDAQAQARARKWESRVHYPYRVADTMVQDAKSFQLDGAVTYGIERSEASSADGDAAATSAAAVLAPFWWPPAAAESSQGDGGSDDGGDGEKPLKWSISAESVASYNRSTSPDRTPGPQSGAASQRFESAAACVARSKAARDGNVTRHDATDSCPGSPARTRLCSAYDECAAPPPTSSHAFSAHPASMTSMTTAAAAQHPHPLLIRRPRRNASTFVVVAS